MVAFLAVPDQIRLSFSDQDVHVHVDENNDTQLYSQSLAVDCMDY